MPLKLHTPLPPLNGATEWIPSPPDFDSLSEAPLLVYFWAMSCHICHANLPKIQSLREEYAPKGLKVISIHCPRMKADVNVEKVRRALEKYDFSEPVAIDNKHKVRKAFDNDYWPAYFLFDHKGTLKCRAAGQNGLTMVEPIIRKLLR